MVIKTGNEEKEEIMLSKKQLSHAKRIELLQKTNPNEIVAAITIG